MPGASSWPHAPRRGARRVGEETKTASEQAGAGAGDGAGASGGAGDRPDADGPRRQPRRSGGRFRGRYGLLLILLLASYLLSAFFSAIWINDAQLVLFTCVGLIAIRNSPIRSHVLQLVAAAALIVGLVLIDLSAHEGGDVGHAVASLWGGVLLLTVVVLLIRQVLSQPDVTLQSIYGAISAYLIIGLMFAAFYSAIYFLRSRTFFAGHEPGDTSTFQYFSFTTLTTLGYGDFTPVANGGRAVAMIEAMTGQIFLATLVAKLVASFRPAARAASGPAKRAASDDE